MDKTMSEQTMAYAIDAIKEQIEVLRAANAQDPDLKGKLDVAQIVCHLSDRVLSHLKPC